MISCPQIRIKQMKRIAIICVILCTPLLINAQVQIPTLDDLDHEIAMSSQYDKQYEDVITQCKEATSCRKDLEGSLRIIRQAIQSLHILFCGLCYCLCYGKAENSKDNGQSEVR